MSEYIEREETLRLIEEMRFEEDDNAHDAAEEIYYLVKDMDDADVAPVAESEWEADGDYLLCARCGVRVSRDLTFSDVGKLNYCPNCGAKIRTED